MQQVFHHYESTRPGVNLIEEIIENWKKNKNFLVMQFLCCLPSITLCLANCHWLLGGKVSEEENFGKPGRAARGTLFEKTVPVKHLDPPAKAFN